ncbi:MAG TPA: biotin transporter BioY [Bacteroidota bacterium]|nr:biotin transporter BioY [Bacteroidota bacterium]
MDTAFKTIVASLEHTQTTVRAQLLWIAFFAGLTALGAQVEIPHVPVPYTLQTFFVLLGAAFLGGRNGSLSQILYLVLGLVGLPVFAGGSGGSSWFLGASGGYLLSFPLGALVIGYIVQRRSNYFWTLAAMFLGLVIIFACGAAFLNIFFLHDIKESIASGFLIFSWWDLLKLTAAAAIYNQFAKRYRKLPAQDNA